MEWLSYSTIGKEAPEIKHTWLYKDFTVSEILNSDIKYIIHPNSDQHEMGDKIIIYLGQDMTLEQLGEIKYRFTLYFMGDASNPLPDYVDVQFSSDSYLDPPENESLRVLAPITKVNEMAEIKGLFMIGSSEYISVTKTTISLSEIEVAELVSKFTPDSYVAPNQQLKNGILSALVKCNEGLEITKKYDNSPVCISADSIDKLEQRNYLSKAGKL